MGRIENVGGWTESFRVFRGAAASFHFTVDVVNEFGFSNVGDFS